VKVLTIVLDAADRELLWRWAAEGELPVLGRMLREGGSARLGSHGGLMPEAAWPTLTTGAEPGSHGVYNWRPIRPRTYQRTRQPPSAARKAFWHVLRDTVPGARAVVLDAPFNATLSDDRITEVVGWGERGSVHHASWPPGLLAELTERHGSFPSWTEDDYVRWPLEERRLLRALEDAIGRRTEILLDLLARGDWDVALACFYELHDGGHAFYRYLDPGSPGHAARRAPSGRAALLRLYRAADTAIGRIRAAVGDDVDLLVCSPKGFRPNTSGEALLPRVLEGLGYQVPRPVAGGSRRVELARGLVRAVAPRPLRRQLFGRVSWQERDRMLEALWIESVDWARSRALAEPDIGSGYIRLNVRGREPQGIVEPGAESDRLAAELTHDLLQLTHASSGAPAVDRVIRREELAPGPNSDLLPDLFVAWTRGVLLDAVRHPRLGVVRERTKDLPTSEHTGEAFAIGSGPRFRAGATMEGALADVAATVLHLAGAPLPRDMEGRTLRDLLDPSVGEERREAVEWALDPWGLRGP
jgi:predicted AlkP superfamily phosphohydrolase/phosphomutase